MEIKVKYADNEMLTIKQAHAGEWYDLRAAENVSMWKGDYRNISLGVCIELPEGYEAILAARSSLFKTFGVIPANGIGVIDHAYCGNNDVWHLPVFKVTGDAITIHKNDRIAQFRIQKCQPECELVTVEKLTKPNRDGFGSSGLT